MRTTVLTVHIVAASLGILSGYVALYAAKGASLHRRSGTLFVYAMVAMAMLGAAIAGIWSVAPTTNIPVGLLTAYLVITALTTVVPRDKKTRRLDIGLMIVALGVGLVLLTFGVQALANGGKRHGVPALMFFLFAAIALSASAGDLRALRSDALAGASRIARHLWRMCMALFIAAGSFAGQPMAQPEAVRNSPWLFLPALGVLVLMVFWLVRIRFTGRAAARPVALVTT